jgi:CRISPR-associated protein Cas2
MTIIVLTRVTPSLRGKLTRWMLELKAGVFLGTLSARVRERLWSLVEGSRRAGACWMVTSSVNEQGFRVMSCGAARCRIVDCDGLQLIQQISHPGSGLGATPEKPSGEACGGDAPVRAPVEAGMVHRELGHLERTVQTESNAMSEMGHTTGQQGQS